MNSKIWNSIKPGIDALVFSNLWISLGALSLYLSVKLVTGLVPVFYEGILVFAASFIGYNFLKLKGLKHEGNRSIFNQWMIKHKALIYLLLFVASLALVYGLSEVNFDQLVILLFSTLLSVIYVGFERFSLRSFWFLKTQIVALVWAIFITGMALADSYIQLPIIQLVTLFSGLFFFILGLTIPFDIRDWKADQLNVQMTTLPMLFGLKGTLVIAILHLVLSFICFLIFSYLALILLPVYLLGVKLVYAINSDSSEYHYTFALDGLIILVYPLLKVGAFLWSLI